jgi:GAF domain-containing protein
LGLVGRRSRQRGRFTLENPGRARAVLNLAQVTEPLQGLAAVPLRDEQTFIGTIWLGYRRAQSLPPDSSNLLTILASQIGVSVSNARLFHRAEQERLRLGAVLEATRMPSWRPTDGEESRWPIRRRKPCCAAISKTCWGSRRRNG